MAPWLRVILAVLVVWVGLGLLLSVLRVAVFLGGLLALPLAVLAGYLVWRRGSR